MTKPLPTPRQPHQSFRAAFSGGAAAVLAAVLLAGCATDSGRTVRTAKELEQEAIESFSKEDAVQVAPEKTIRPGASLSDMPHARLAAQSNNACIAALETVAERFSGRRVVLGEKAFVDSSELVLDQVFVKGPDGNIIDGRRGKPNPFIMQLRFGPNGCMAVVPAQSSAVRPVPAATLVRECRCFAPAQQ